MGTYYKVPTISLHLYHLQEVTQCEKRENFKYWIDRGCDLGLNVWPKMSDIWVSRYWNMYLLGVLSTENNSFPKLSYHFTTYLKTASKALTPSVQQPLRNRIPPITWVSLKVDPFLIKLSDEITALWTIWCSFEADETLNLNWLRPWSRGPSLAGFLTHRKEENKCVLVQPLQLCGNLLNGNR